MNLTAHRIHKAISISSMPFRLPFIPRRPDPQDIAKFALSSYGIRPLQVESELIGLARTVYDLKPKALMEIGTNQGGTLLVLCRMADPAATVVSVDLPHSKGGKFGGGYTPFQIPIFKMFATARQKLHLLRADSHASETLRSVSSLLADKKLDFLFIDGDHTYAGVKADFEMYSPLVRKGGIVAFHDIAVHPRETGCEVHVFWDEIKKQYRNTEIVTDKNQGWAGIGLVTM